MHVIEPFYIDISQAPTFFAINKNIKEKQQYTKISGLTLD